MTLRMDGLLVPVAAVSSSSPLHGAELIRPEERVDDRHRGFREVLVGKLAVFRVALRLDESDTEGVSSDDAKVSAGIAAKDRFRPVDVVGPKAAHVVLAPVHVEHQSIAGDEPERHEGLWRHAEVIVANRLVRGRARNDGCGSCRAVPDAAEDRGLKGEAGNDPHLLRRAKRRRGARDAEEEWRDVIVGPVEAPDAPRPRGLSRRTADEEPAEHHALDWITRIRE